MTATRLPRDGRYSSVAIAFHWTIAVLVILNLAVGLLHDGVPALRAWMPGHKAIGLLVLVLTAARVAWRLVHRPPALPADLPVLEKRVAHMVHWILYALLIAMPLTGWMMVSGGTRPLTFFELFDVPQLPIGKAASGFGHEAHGVLGWLMLALVVLHIAAALRHHLLLRDDVLARMAPGLARSGRSVGGQ